MPTFECRFYALALSAWFVAAMGTQATVPATLPAALRDHVKADRFQVVTSLRGLPLGVRDSLQTLFGGSLDIAESAAEFQAAGAAGNPRLKLRRLIAAGCSGDHCLVYYERGGGTHTWLIALFEWTPAETRLQWGGNAHNGLTGLEDVRGAVLSGAIKGPVTAW